MGRGITTRNGADPLDEWQLRIANFGSSELSAALRALLGGDQVQSTDGVLEVSVMAMSRQDVHAITVLCPDAPFAAELVVRAVALTDAGPTGDDREAFPGPGAWQGTLTDVSAVWELFNCVVHTLISRSNSA